MNNLEFLKINVPNVYSTIQNKDSYNVTVDFKNFVVKKDDLKLTYHSINHFENELARLCRSIDATVEAVVIFGVGNGKLITHLLNTYELNRIIVIEPSINIFKAALENINFIEIANSNCDVSLFIDKTTEEVVNVLKLIYSDKLSAKIIENISARTLFFDYFKTISTKLVNIIRTTTVNLSTNQFWRLKWQENVIKNLINNYDILPNGTKPLLGKTVFIVGAGPSLDRDVNELKKYMHLGYVFGVGTGSRILNENDLKADYRVVVDGIQTYSNLSNNPNEDDIPLLYSNKVNHELINLYKGPKIEYLLDNDYIVQYLYDQEGIDPQIVRSSFSVAQVALDMVIKLGASQIILLGMDCAYTNNRLHAENDGEEHSDQYVDIDFTTNDRYLKTVDKYGNDCYSDSKLMGMKSETEFVVRMNPDAQIYNASSGGLSFEGVEDITLNHFFDKHEEVTKKALNLGMTKSNNKISRLEVLNSELEQLLSLIELSMVEANKIIKLGVDEFEIVDYLSKTETQLKTYSLYTEVFEKVTILIRKAMDLYIVNNNNYSDLEIALTKLTLGAEYMYMVKSVIDEINNIGENHE